MEDLEWSIDTELEKITKAHLSEQDPVSVPGDWDMPGNYHPVCVKIWKKWLVFVQVFIGMQTKEGFKI